MIVLKEHNSHYDCGGKARNLFVLQQLGFRVPPFVVIPAEVCRDIVKGKAQATAAIHAMTFEENLIQSIVASLPSAFYSVRSSASAEDGKQFSFAGQFSSYLFVNRASLAQRIKDVWLSAYSERVQEYRKTNGLPQDAGIAVIIQVMLDADAAGVAFGINPVSGNRREKLVSAVFGLGEGLVSGELDADTFIVKGNGSVEKKIVAKKHKLVQGSEGGTKITAVNEENIHSPSIRNEHVAELSNVLDRLYKHYHSYQDIEFAVCGDELFLLQTRPITSHTSLADSSGEFVIWDNSNIIESYPGVTTPLTFSFILPVYEAVYRQFAMLMGVSEKEVEKNKEVFANMLGLINGRVYYNLLSWYKALALLPGYSLNAGFMEKMMGVKERFELKDVPKRSAFSERLRVFNMVRILLKNLRALPQMRVKFMADFNTKLQEFNGHDFSKKNPHELMALYSDFEQTLLKKWKAPLVNDFFAMIYFGVLQKLAIKHCGAESNVQNDLLCGARDIISTEPMHRCVKLATEIQANGVLAKQIADEPAENFLSRYHKKELPAAILQQIDEYIEKFGNRCVGELKLETVTYRQDPLAFLKLIKSYIEQGVSEKGFLKSTDIELRELAEQKVKTALKGKPMARLFFNYILKRARSTVSARENLRYERTRAFGVVRDIFCELGNRFYAEGILENSRDIFYLTRQEISDYVKGTSVNFNLKDLIALRKKQYSEFEARTTRERIKTNGVVYLGNEFYADKKDMLHPGGINGLGCCPGQIKARVQVVRNPTDVKNLNGDILVTSSTDPGWVTLFPTASGILVERGSLLSHSAIVSREMGKPCIVGITGLLEMLETGDEVEMDGATGIVNIIKKANAN